MRTSSGKVHPSPLGRASSGPPPPPPAADGVVVEAEGEGEGGKQSQGGNNDRLSLNGEESTSDQGFAPTDNLHLDVHTSFTAVKEFVIAKLNMYALLAKEQLRQGFVMHKEAFKHNSLRFLTPENPVRKIAISIVCSWWFEIVIGFLILFNTIILIIATYDIDSQLQEFVDISDLIVSISFSLEMTVKIVALGFVGHEGAYLRGGWNIFDSIVVAAGWLKYAPQSHNFSGLRALRLLRPLRKIGGNKRLRILVRTLFESLPLLFDVVVVWLFILTVFSIVALELFRGKFLNHCVDLSTGKLLASDAASGVPRSCGGYRECPVNETVTAVCGETYVNNHGGISTFQNPNNGYTSFDNFGKAVLVLFQAMSQEGWTDMLTLSRDSVSEYAIIFWLPMMIIGSFFVVNFAIAVLYAAFTRLAIKEEDMLSNETRLSQISFPNTPSSITAASNLSGLTTEEQASRSSTFERISHFEKSFADAKKASISLQKQVHNLMLIRMWRGNKEWKIPLWERGRLVVKQIIASPYFQYVIMTVIIVNSVCLAMEYNNMPSERRYILEIVNACALLVFTLEVLLYSIGLGVFEYLSDNFAKFDVLIVTVSIVELSLYGIGGSRVSVFRALRLLRLVKLMKTWSSMRMLLFSVVRSMGFLSNFLVVVVILLITMALVGVQMFKGKFIDTSEINSGHYAVLTGENWHVMMYRAEDKAASVAYFLLMLIFGHYLTYNVVMVAVIRQFLTHQEYFIAEKTKAQVIEQLQSTQSRERLKNKAQKSKDKDAMDVLQKWVVATEPRQNGNYDLREKEEEEDNITNLQLWRANSMQLDRWNEMVEALPSFNRKSYDPANPFIDPSFVIEGNGLARIRGNIRSIFVHRRDYSLWLFSPDGKIRKTLQQILAHPYFERFIIVLVLFVCILLAIDSPNREKTHSTLYTLDLVATALFSVEAIMKIISKGFVWPHPGPYGPAYFRVGWNIMDFIIVVLSITSLALEDIMGSGAKGIKALRIFRVLRPLHLLNNNSEMKLVVDTMLSIGQEVANIMILLLLVIFTYGVLGVQLMSGRMSECSDPSREYEFGYGHALGGADECIGTYVSDGILVERKWGPQRPNFDHIGEAMMTLCGMLTLEDWDAVMYKGISTRGTHVSPKPGSTPVMAIYFISYIVVVSLFLMNFLVASLVSRYMDTKATGNGFIMLSGSQKQWILINKVMNKERPEVTHPPPKSSWRSLIYNLVENKYFEIFIMSCIAINVAVLASVHDNSSPTFDDVLEILEKVFVGIFALEACLKLIAYSVNYFHDRWNIFDFTITVFSLLGVLTESLETDINFNPSIVRGFRVLRALRALRLVRRAKSLRKVTRTLSLSLPSLVNVGFLLVLVLFMYAVLGMHLFGDLEGVFEDKLWSFQTFGRSSITLFRVLTGENWEEIMHRLISKGRIAIMPYFATYFVLVYYVIMNLFIAVMLENFSEAEAIEESIIGPYHFAMFTDVWAEFDPAGSQFIKATQLPDLIRKIPSPLGTDVFWSAHYIQFIHEAFIPVREGELVHYFDVMYSLAYRVLGRTVPKQIQAEMKKLQHRAFPILAKKSKLLHMDNFQERFSAAHIVAAVVIQRQFRRVVKARIVEREKQKQSLLKYLGARDEKVAPSLVDPNAHADEGGEELQTIEL